MTPEAIENRFGSSLPAPFVSPEHPSDGGVAVFPADHPWYVLRVHSRAEKAVAERLNSLRYTREPVCVEADAMCYTAVRKTSKNKRRVIVPLFSQYIFIRCNESDLRRCTQRTEENGIVGFLRKAGTARVQPAEIPHEKIESLRIYLREMERQEVASITVNPILTAYERGTEVEVIDGQFQGIRGIVQNMRAKLSEVRILIPELGALTLTLPTQQVQKI